MSALRTHTRARRPATSSRRARSAPATPTPPSEVARHRRAGGPEDVALYTCGCGYAFAAAVTAAVDCPRCGGEQAW